MTAAMARKPPALDLGMLAADLGDMLAKYGYSEADPRLDLGDEAIASVLPQVLDLLRQAGRAEPGRAVTP